MKTFNDFTGLDGIDKLTECAQYVGEILADREAFKDTKKDTSWLEVAAKVYKAHKDACDKLLKELEYEPASSLEIIKSVAKILRETFNDKEILSFFISVSGIRNSSTSVTENTGAEQ